MNEMPAIPRQVGEAEAIITNWFDKNGLTRWEFWGIADRRVVTDLRAEVETLKKENSILRQKNIEITRLNSEQAVMLNDLRQVAENRKEQADRYASECGALRDEMAQKEGISKAAERPLKNLFAAAALAGYTARQGNAFNDARTLAKNGDFWEIAQDMLEARKEAKP